MKQKNKLLKQIKAFLLMILIIPAMLVFAGCDKKQLSAYDLAVDNGFIGTESEWLDSLKGKSAYDLAVENGFVGTESEWLDSLKGKDADQIDSYDLYLSAVENENYLGTYMDFIKENLIETVDRTAVVSNKVAMSVVEVKAYASGFGGTASSAGSGVIYKLDSEGNAYVITNYHVTYNQYKNNKAHESYALYLYGVDSSKAIPATFVGGSATYDISILKVENSSVLIESNASAVELDTSTTKLGTTCLAVGSPSFGSPKKTGVSVSRGIVSRDSEITNMTIAGKNRRYRLIRHDAFTYGGSSGGGLFDLNGKLIGITNGGESNLENANYAIPANIVYNVAENILRNSTSNDNYSAIVPDIGISVQTSQTMTTYNSQTGYIDIVDTIVISKMDENSLFKNDLQTGDILKSVILNEGKAYEIHKDITRYYELSEFLLLSNPNDTIKIIIERDGAEINVTKTLGEDSFIELE